MTSINDTERVGIPQGMSRFIDQAIKDKWVENNGTDEDFFVTGQEIAQCFNWSVERTCQLIDDQLNCLEPGDRCDVLILVGGYSASPFLETTIRQRFASRFQQIVVPVEPATAIVQGAVIYGLSPNAIPRRRVRMSYGFLAYVSPEKLTQYDPADVEV